MSSRITLKNYPYVWVGGEIPKLYQKMTLSTRAGRV